MNIKLTSPLGIWCAPQKWFQMLRESLCQFRQGDFDDEEKGKAAHAGANS